MRDALVLAAALLACFFASFPVWWFARRAPAYSHVRDTISELGAVGARDQHAVAWLAFVPAGIGVWLFCLALRHVLPMEDAITPLWMLALVGVGYVGAAIFPCDAGAPFGGSVRNNLHNILGGLGYFGGGAALIEFGRLFDDIARLHDLADASRTLGPCVLLGLFGLSFPSPVRGVVQRVVETILFGWMLLVGVWWVR